MASKSKSKSKSPKQKPTATQKKAELEKQKQEAKEDLDEKTRLGYLDSTQRKHWLFKSASVIHEKRLHSLNKEILHLKSHCADFDVKYAASIPTQSEYFSSLSYYCKEIIQICRKFTFPHYVSCTAVTYFKRFFLNSKYNLISIDGMCMKDTCIYLASKTEQSLLEGITQLTGYTNVPPAQVVNHELILMDGINFHLKIWNPFRPFRSFLCDFKIVWKKKQKCVLNETYVLQIETQGFDLIQDSFISDVCLIYTPSQIALSCLLLAIGGIDIKYSKNLKDGKQIAKIKKDTQQIKKMCIYYFDFRFKNNKQFEKLKQTTKDIQYMIIDAINKTNDQNYAKLQANGNTKLFKLQTLYYQIKNGKVNNNNHNKKQTGKKKKIKLKISNKKRKATHHKNKNKNKNNISSPPTKRQKLTRK